jgi:beta-lactamase regulating signal transducer with metallopeptidase domain/uncharacterized protein YjbI with pentapeptide repeats
MEQFFSFIPREIMEAIGWTLFHSLWQGVAIAIILAIVLISFGKFSAHARYIVTFITLIFMLLCTTYTFIRSYNYTSERAKLREQIISNPQIVVQHFVESIKKTEIKQAASKDDVQFRIKWIFFKSYLQKQFPIIVSVWLLGMVFFLFRFMGGLLVVKRMGYRQTSPVEEKLEHLTSAFAAKLNIKRKVALLQSLAVKVPVTIGYLKPVILLPASILSGLTPAEIESIIAHELAHIARRDYLFNIIQSLIEILFFYHPAIWWISSVARTERENSCDDIAIELTGDKLIYAKALANMQEQTFTEPSYAMAFGNNKNRLFKRVKRLLTHNAMKTNFKEGFIASCILFTGILVITLFAGASANQQGNAKIQEKDTTRHNSVTPGDSTSTASELESLKEAARTDEDLKEAKKDLLEDLENINISDDLQKELEIALGDLDLEISYEVLKGVKGALNNMDINLIVSEAMKGAKAAVNNMDVNAIVHESMKNCNDRQVDVDKISREALNGASAALEEMDLNLIINEALKGAEGALKEIDLKNLINESLEKELKSDYRNLHKHEQANQYHAIISGGTEEWNEWRSENETIIPDLTDIHLKGLNLQQANLSNVSLTNAVIEGSDFGKANFSGVNACDIKINGTKLNGADFENANLCDGRFYGNVLDHVNFKYANLVDAVLSGCTIKNCDFRNANLCGTNFTGCTLEKCNFKDAIASEDTKFPNGFDPRKHGIKID